MPRHRMTEKERAYFFVLLFPLLWPLGVAMLMCDAFDGIGRGIRTLWRRIRNGHR